MGLFDDLNGLLGGISDTVGNVADIANAVSGIGGSSSSGGALGTIVVPPPPSFEELISNIGVFGGPPQIVPPPVINIEPKTNYVPLIGLGAVAFFVLKGGR